MLAILEFLYLTPAVLVFIILMLLRAILSPKFAERQVNELIELTNDPLKLKNKLVVLFHVLSALIWLTAIIIYFKTR